MMFRLEMWVICTSVKFLDTIIACDVVFIDSEAPRISCTEDLSVQTDEGKPSAMVLWEAPLASDNSGNVSVTCDPPTGTNFAIGQSTVTCKAIDGSGNTAPCSFQVNVTGKMCSQNL